MQYVASNVETLRGRSLIGNGSFVLLVQHYAKVPKHDQWRQGPRVVEQDNIWPGTPIATFENGVYPNWPTGNHAALFLRFGNRGEDGTRATFWVVEQYKGLLAIGERELKRKGQVDSKWGKRWADPSNNADAFYIIQ